MHPGLHRPSIGNFPLRYRNVDAHSSSNDHDHFAGLRSFNDIQRYDPVTNLQPTYYQLTIFGTMGSTCPTLIRTLGLKKLTQDFRDTLGLPLVDHRFRSS